MTTYLGINKHLFKISTGIKSKVHKTVSHEPYHTHHSIESLCSIVPGEPDVVTHVTSWCIYNGIVATHLMNYAVSIS